MKVYTSYFANGKKLAAAGVMMVGIAQFPPKWFHGVSVRYVAPSPSILYAKNQSDETYTVRYQREVLSRVDPRAFLRHLEQLGGGKDVALCCYEKPDAFCHRHILAKWMTERLGIKVEEFVDPEQKVEKPKYKQLSLFDEMQY